MLKFAFIFKLYLYDVWHTSKGWYLFWNEIFNKQLLKHGQCLCIPHFCTKNSNKTSIHFDLFAQSLLTKTLLNMFVRSIFVRLTTTTTNPCVSINFLLSDRFTPQHYSNSCTGSAWWKYPELYIQLTWWDYFPGQLCFHETMTCTNREKETAIGIRLNYAQSEWLNSTLHSKKKLDLLRIFYPTPEHLINT